MRERKLFDLTAVPALLGTASSVEGAIHGKMELSSKVAGVEHRGQFAVYCIMNTLIYGKANTGIRIGRALYLTKHIKNIRILKR